MWLLPLQTRIASLATRTFYRFHVDGDSPPQSGPLLLIANHPNMLLDPAAVATAAGRPVRFLAKAPLFENPVTRFFLHSIGAIPVYRRHDDPSRVGKNEEMFREVHRALAGGAAIGIFPEGKSHGEPALAPLRTGAARMAIGAAAILGRDFPIIPIGLTLSRKESFRSEAFALVGLPVEWNDLSSRKDDDEDAVRQLTQRIDESLREVTLNLEQWEDAPAIAFAEAVYAAEFRLPDEKDERLQRLRNIAQGLHRLRKEAPDRLDPLLADVTKFREISARMGIEPSDLSMVPRVSVAIRWAAPRILLSLVLIPLLIGGTILFYLPYRLITWVARKVRTGKESRSTVKLVAGAIIFLSWVLILTLLFWRASGPLGGLLSFVFLPILALLTISTQERVMKSLSDARAFLFLSRRTSGHESLRQWRTRLAQQIEETRRQLATKD